MTILSLALSLVAGAAAPACSPAADPTVTAAAVPAATPAGSRAVAPAVTPTVTPAGAQEIAPPPGLIFVPGGRTTIGSDKDHLEELIRAEAIYAPSFASEFPQQTINVQPFYLMPTEVTNEQYAEFVRATDHRVPYHWADEEAANAAQAAFLEEQGRKRKEALDAGEPTPPSEKFDRKAWWERNWRDFEWAIPAGQDAHPVIWVDYRDATAYADWAGLRLMTEFEYQAAGRGKESDPYPWGEEWDDDKVVSSANRGRASEAPVGSTGFATEGGFHDLLGNVWEWTQSPYVAFDKYKPFTVDVGEGRRQREVKAAAEWNADYRVAVGGAWNSPQTYCRLTTRRRCDRTQQTSALGFRCAASPGLATDGVAAAIDALPRVLRPEFELEPIAALSFDRWVRRDGSVDIDGYDVITGYDLFSIIPVEQIPHGNPSTFGVQTLDEGPVGVAVLTTTVPILEPALEPGSYLIAYRDKGKPRGEAEEEVVPAEGIERQEGEDDAPEEELPYDVNTANLIISDASGAIVHVIPFDGVEYASIDDDYPDGRLTIEPYVEPRREDEGGLVADNVAVRLDVSSRNRRKAMRFEFDLKIDRGLVDDTWRRRK